MEGETGWEKDSAGNLVGVGGGLAGGRPDGTRGLGPGACAWI